MCNKACIQFAESYISETEIKDRRVIEVGSLNVNGSLRSFLQQFHPSLYLGVDIMSGAGVDMVCDVKDLVRRFGKNSFDVVICTEVLEHILNWRHGISNLKNILKSHGTLLVTTRSKGFGYHGYPFDFWRFEVEDVQAIFSDIYLEIVEKDPSSPGVFFKGSKPDPFIELDYDGFRLYSIIRSARCKDIRKLDIIRFRINWYLQRFLSAILPLPFKNLVKKVLMNMVSV
jgi:SAM-dependent methyltransferase